MTYAFLALFDTCFDFGDVALGFLVGSLRKVALAQDGKGLLDGQLALAEALPSTASRHFEGWKRQVEFRCASTSAPRWSDGPGRGRLLRCCGRDEMLGRWIGGQQQNLRGRGRSAAPGADAGKWRVQPPKQRPLCRTPTDGQDAQTGPLPGWKSRKSRRASRQRGRHSCSRVGGHFPMELRAWSDEAWWAVGGRRKGARAGEAGGDGGVWTLRCCENAQ